ncbi:hypothetical protein HK102_004413 [Quaeritorhiza haematococci]|nr:hypothetical protein HK102_004413 [Quaeritorhiza haematococci]
MSSEMTAPATTASAGNNDLLSMSLDDIIAKNKKTPGNRRRGGGGANGGNAGAGSGGAVRSGRRGRGGDNRSRPYSNPRRSQPQQQPAGYDQKKIAVSNLAYNVTQQDVFELFSQVGPVSSATLNYDANGRSKGSATVLFQRNGDALAAVREYHNRTLDGRPMKIEIIMSGTIAASLTSPSGGDINRRVGAAPGGGGNKSGSGSGAGGRRTGGGAGGRGRRSGRGRPKGGSNPRPSKTAEELDAEMEAYLNGKDEGSMEVEDAGMTDANGAAADVVPA